ncbi:hypothetical protein [Streptomyces erythrochromogenes]|uniref:hypothetical protein n=1 Tax=Streptomyces erythrochromogenes TaxID=285574 RepID=UPI00386B637A|nr:transposase [Streptomyces erythrochromogenes]
MPGVHGVRAGNCHGWRAQIMPAYREGQADQLCALGSILNAAVLWTTTRSLDADVEQLHARPARPACRAA